MIIELKPARTGNLSIANSSVGSFEVVADFVIPEGHIGMLKPGPTVFEHGYYTVSANIAPGMDIIKPGKYTALNVHLWNQAGSSLRYTTSSVIAQLVIIPCLDTSQNTGKDTQSGSLSSSSGTSKKSSTSTGQGSASKKSSQKGKS